MRQYSEQNGSCNCTERKQLLWEIDKVSFAIVEMTLYLDTHPHEMEAIDYLNHYNKKKRQLMKEYAMKFSPLTVDMAQDNECEHWKWALEPLPWKGDK